MLADLYGAPGTKFPQHKQFVLLIERDAHEGVQIVVDLKWLSWLVLIPCAILLMRFDLSLRTDHLLHHSQQLEIHTRERDWTPLGVQMEGGVRVRADHCVMLGEAGHIGQFGFGGADGQLREKRLEMPFLSLSLSLKDFKAKVKARISHNPDWTFSQTETFYSSLMN